MAYYTLNLDKGHTYKMITKEFQLNKSQNIEIPIDHPIYKDVLIANLANQNIVELVKPYLINQNYFQILRNPHLKLEALWWTDHIWEKTLKL